MSIQFGGLASGLDVDGIISKLINIEKRPVDLLKQQKVDINTQQAEFSNLQDRVTKLADALKKITAKSFLDTDPFQANKTASSNAAAISATAGPTAPPQTFTVEVVSLATATKATSTSLVGSLATATTALPSIAKGAITAGAFSVFVDGTESRINVDPLTDSVDSVLAQVRSLTGLSASVNTEGKIALGFTAGQDVKLGSSSDTSNFLEIAQLSTATRTGTSLTSSRAITTINVDEIINTAAANLQVPVTAGSTFKVGKATFDTTGKSLRQILDDVNNSTDAGVNANYNPISNKIEFTSKAPGSALITLEDISGNFLKATGLVSLTGDTTVSQSAGAGAEFKLNGATLYSTTNTVNELTSGLAGVTLNLTQVTAGTPATISITRDTDKLKETLRDFVKTYNEVVRFIDEKSNAENKGPLRNISGLRQFRASLRQIVTDSVSGLSSFNSLPQIGISTGAVNTGSAKGGPTQLTFDESKLDAALATNAAQVKQLAVGTSGAITRLETLVKTAITDDPDDSKDGLFASRKNTSQARIKDIDKAITRGQARLDAKEQFYRNQFTLMEKLISQSQSQGNAITALNNQLNTNNNSR